MTKDVLATVIRRHRIKCGLSQRKLAAKVGAQPAAVSKWERGDRRPTAVFFPKLAKSLKVDVEFLIDAAGSEVKS